MRTKLFFFMNWATKPYDYCKKVIAILRVAHKLHYYQDYEVNTMEGMAGEPMEYINFYQGYRMRVTREEFIRDEDPEMVNILGIDEHLIAESNHASAVSWVE